MARPVDPHRRDATLVKAADYVLEHGLADLSLRPLAKALGTSPRMLLYDFESKEALIDDVLAEIRRRLAAMLEDRPLDLPSIWAWISAPEREPFLRLFFEVYVRELDRAHPLVRDWLDVLAAHDVDDPPTATLMVAVVRGLLLDRLSAPDPERTDAAFERFVELLTPSSAAGRAGRGGTSPRTRRRPGDGRT
jgi:AcrR family transcriptional regulator